MTCLHNHDQILEFLRKIFLKGFQIYQNYLCALNYLSSVLKSFIETFPGDWQLFQYVVIDSVGMHIRGEVSYRKSTSIRHF